MSVEIQAARPEQYTDQVADLDWSVDAPLMTYLLRDKETWRRLFLAEWPRQDGLVCYPWIHLAIEDGQVLGLMISHDSARLDERYERTLNRWCASEPLELSHHLTRTFSVLERLFPHPPQDSYYVLHLAVDPQARQIGIGRRLMEIAELQARALGRSSLHLDMNADNVAAGFYRRLGMRVEIETRLPALEHECGIGLHQHWVKALN